MAYHNPKQVQWTTTKSAGIDGFPFWLDSFLNDRKLQGVSQWTIVFYQKKLKKFDAFLSKAGLERVKDVEPNHIRVFLLELESDGHNPGGIHAFFRVLRAFFRWYEAEDEPEPPWRNPMTNVKVRATPIEPLKPADLETVQRLISTCGQDYFGTRDRSIFLLLLDTGLRASELCDLDLHDADLTQGVATVRAGKGGKSRTVIYSRQTVRALRKYLKVRPQGLKPLFLTKEQTRLTYWGLRQIVRRRSVQAGVPTPQLHAFRRAFALNCLRNGMDVFTLQRLMGHADLQVLRRYLAQTDDDLRAAHAKASPVDNLL